MQKKKNFNTIMRIIGKSVASKKVLDAIPPIIQDIYKRLSTIASFRLTHSR